MTDKELRRLGRAELLQLMLEQSRRIEKLEKENAELKARLQDRVLVMEQSGSIAEASMKLSGIFEAAQCAADQYLDSLRAQAERGGRQA